MKPLHLGPRLRAAIFVFLYLPVITVICTLPGVLWHKLTGSRRVIDWSSNQWCRWINAFLGVRVHEHGRENIPAGGCLFLFNHRSFMDIFAMNAKQKGIRFGAKLELFSIPIFNWAIRAAGILPIARQNRQEAIQVLKDAESRARNGEKFALAPEGSRNDAEGLLPFKAGPFVFAIRTGVPVIPVVIRGANLAWRKHKTLPCAEKWFYDIDLTYLPAVDSTQFTIDQRSEFARQVREMMLKV